MNRATVERLNRINQAFYGEHAEDFSRTRSRAWGGWQRIFAALPPAETLSVLDVGCGNGRLAVELRARFGLVDYVGLDSSGRLLELATRSIRPLTGVDAELATIDLTDELPGDRFGELKFDLVAAFGLFHHLPSRELRLGLLTDLARLTGPAGVLAVGFWQFGAHERFRRRFVNWTAFNRATSEPVDLGQLEEGDHLLAWGEGAGAVRYCHWAPPAEARRLLDEAGLVASELYEADGENGRLNLYALIRPA